MSSTREHTAAALDRREAGRIQGALGTVFTRSLTSDGDVGRLALRLTLAAVIFPHGAQKLLGWFGGAGFEGTMQFFTGTMGLPAIVAFLVVVAEFFGPIALALGFLTRFAALGIGAVMVGAMVTTHLEFGFFMNWFGDKAGEGIEYHLLALGIALALVIGGGGALAVDRVIADRRTDPAD